MDSITFDDTNFMMQRPFYEISYCCNDHHNNLSKAHDLDDDADLFQRVHTIYCSTNRRISLD